MTLTLELPPELERRLQAEAARHGQPPSDYALAVLASAISSDGPAEDGSTLADTLAGYVGVFHSGSDGRGAENTSEQFAAGMAEKRAAGNL